MSKERPLVSIIIPTYRNRGNLKRAIDSALNQTYSPIEVIVVDDNNPTDQWRKTTAAEMDFYINDKRVIYKKHLHNKNGAAARNTGIKESRGDYIAFLDDDDYFKADKIEIQVNYLQLHPEYQAAYSQCERGEIIIAKNLPSGNLGKEILLLKTKLFTPSLIFKANAIKQINGFDESFNRHQDYELMLRFFNEGFNIGAIQKPLTVIGTNGGENIPNARAMEELKAKFLKKFDAYITEYSTNDRFYRNKVYARNYSGVFLSYIKIGNCFDALRVMVKYAWRSPYYFFWPLIETLKYHLTKKNN